MDAQAHATNNPDGNAQVDHQAKKAHAINISQIDQFLSQKVQSTLETELYKVLELLTYQFA